MMWKMTDCLHLTMFEEDFVGNWKNSRDFCKDIHIRVKVNDCRIEGCK